MGNERRREVAGIFIGSLELGTAKPAVYVNVLGKSMVYFTPRQALEFADAIREEAYAALGHGVFGDGTA